MAERGGKRPGAGRKAGSGTYGEATVQMRVPASQAPAVADFLAAFRARREKNVPDELLYPSPAPSRLQRPLFLGKVPAGFPSPADDYVERRLDLNEHLVRHREATFFARVQGDSMTGAGIHDGDLLVVDRALEPVSGKVVVAVLDGELTVKRLAVAADGHVSLLPENPAYPELVVKDGMNFEIWGVVTNVIHAL